MIVVIRFSLKIENQLESEFMNVMSVSLAKELLKGLGLEVGELEEKTPAQPEPAPAPAPVVDENTELLKEIRDLLKANAKSNEEKK